MDPVRRPERRASVDADRGLALSPEQLLAECEVSTTRVSGPGGQHRNRRDTGILLHHRPTGVVAQATERRSQHQNKAEALRRLRRRIALTVRCPLNTEGFAPPQALAAVLPGRRQRIRPSNDRFWEGAALLLDLFAACDGAVAEAAALLGLTTGSLSKLLTGDADLLEAANRIRTDHGLHVLRR